jgi:hypothetical protein
LGQASSGLVREGCEVGKYDPLRDYLTGVANSEVRMSFSDLERLVGALPPSARTHRAWWGNNTANVEARAWMSTGWRVQSVNQAAEYVVFAHDGSPLVSAPSVSGTGHVLTDLFPDSVYAQRYRVVRLLGKGERKRTYLAWDMKGRRQVALAIVTDGTDPGATQREAEILGPVHQHPGIVTLYDFEAEPGRQYMVFEYLAGGELGEHCRYLASQGVRMPLPEFFRLARQLCRALSHIHDHGIVHRDVSMSNIWLDERGEAHLGDFDTAVSKA